jgi:aspartate aminotransferase-like enzyme
VNSPPLRFVPGPAHVRPDVLAAMARPPVPHRSAEFEQMLGRVQSGLAKLLGTRSAVFPVLGSSTTSLETALRGIARRRVLVPSNGAFSERLAKSAAAIGLSVETLAVPPGDAIEPDLVQRALSAGHFDTVAVVHNATCSGVISDVVGIAAAVRNAPGVALVVDAVSSFGGVDLSFDDLGPDAVLISTTSKCLSCPPGGSILAVAPGARERAAAAEGAGHALSLTRLLENHDKGRAPNTPNTALTCALDVQVAAVLTETLPERARRHSAMARLVQEWAEEHFAVLARPGARSPTVTAIENTRGLDIARLRAAVRTRGFEIAGGYGVLKDATFRIGHMGDVTVDDTHALLAALDAALLDLGD